MMGGVAAHIGRALAAGLIGSVVATIPAMPLLRIGDEINPHTSEILTAGPIPLGLALLAVSLFFTLPSALMLAAPLTWPFREWIASQPLLAALAYGAIGGAAGWSVSSFLDGGVFDPGGRIGAVYGAATGIGFVLMLRLAHNRTLPEPALEEIFE